MAGTATEERTFTEQEKDALVADAVARETAALSEREAALERELTEHKQQAEQARTELERKLDTTEAEKATAVTERDQLRTEFDTFKTQLEAEKAAAERQDARVAEIREVAAGLHADYFTAERATRWAAMSDDDFAAHKAELAAIAGAVSPAGGPPRETAMSGQTPQIERASDTKPSATKAWLLGAPASPDPAST